MTEASTLAGLLQANEIIESEVQTIVAALAAPPFMISTIKHFANYFDTKTEVNTMFCQNEANKADEAPNRNLCDARAASAS